MWGNNSIKLLSLANINVCCVIKDRLQRSLHRVYESIFHHRKTSRRYRFIVWFPLISSFYKHGSRRCKTPSSPQPFHYSCLVIVRLLLQSPIFDLPWNYFHIRCLTVFFSRLVRPPRKNSPFHLEPGYYPNEQNKASYIIWIKTRTIQLHNKLNCNLFLLYNFCLK